MTPEIQRKHVTDRILILIYTIYSNFGDLSKSFIRINQLFTSYSRQFKEANDYSSKEERESKIQISFLLKNRCKIHGSLKLSCQRIFSSIIINFKCDFVCISRIIVIYKPNINLAKIKRSYNKFEDQMRRFFFRPMLDFADPFFPFQRRFFTPTWKINLRSLPAERNERETQQRNDPHSIFEQFFKENELKNEAQKEFFKKHFPQKTEEKFDPYKVLGLKADATLDQVKEAYRSLALKYHPKSDSSAEAEAKFSEVAKAYEAIIDSNKNRGYEDFGFGSFFEDFEKQIDSLVGKPEEGKAKDAKSQAKQHYGELYSESSHYETVNGQQTKYVIEKVYKKNGKFLTVKREQKLKDDGKVEITETIDNGKQVKKKSYIQENDVKKLSS